jgi:hypothetical protein
MCIAYILLFVVELHILLRMDFMVNEGLYTKERLCNKHTNNNLLRTSPKQASQQTRDQCSKRISNKPNTTILQC